MGGKLRFQREQSERKKNQNYRGKARGKKVKRESREQNEDHAHHAGYHRPWVVELHIKSQGADGEQDERHIRIHEEIQNTLAHGHIENSNRLADQIQCDGLSVETLDWLPLQLLEEIVFVCGYVIEQML